MLYNRSVLKCGQRMCMLLANNACLFITRPSQFKVNGMLGVDRKHKCMLITFTKEAETI